MVGQRKRRRFAKRSAMTLMEVLFAIAIAMVGLLGIASLLPLAGRNAAESTRAAEGQALANLWYDELIVRGVGNPSNWEYFLDGGSTPGYVDYSATKEAVCVDPNFMTSRLTTRDIPTALLAGAYNRQPNGSVPDPLRWYRPAVFPYYHENYNPLLDPTYTVSATGTTYGWPVQPRMRRMTLAGALGRVPAKFIDDMLSSTDDLAIDVENADASIPPTRHFDPASPSVGMGRMASKGEYSWLMTICPTDTLIHDDPVSQALLSLVVIYRRDLLFFDPVEGLPAKIQGAPSDTDAKPDGERVFWVVPQTDTSGAPVPFKGGHGGTVTLVGSDGIDSTLRVGDWVMLAKNRTTSGDPVFRWYRIIATDGDAEYFIPDPASTTTPPVAISAGMLPSNDGVWARKVVLDGPDWIFENDSPKSPLYPAPPNYTTATYIPGAVAVHERVIPY